MSKLSDVLKATKFLQMGVSCGSNDRPMICYDNENIFISFERIISARGSRSRIRFHTDDGYIFGEKIPYKINLEKPKSTDLEIVFKTNKPFSFYNLPPICGSLWSVHCEFDDLSGDLEFVRYCTFTQCYIKSFKNAPKMAELNFYQCKIDSLDGIEQTGATSISFSYYDSDGGSYNIIRHFTDVETFKNWWANITW